MAITVINKDSNLIVEMIESNDQVADGDGDRPVARTLQSVLTKNSKIFAAMFGPSHLREAQQELVKLEEDRVVNIGIRFRILHDADLVHGASTIGRDVASDNKFRQV